VLLTLIHRRVTDRAILLRVSAGWHTHLDILVARLSGTQPLPFWTAEPLAEGIRTADAGLTLARSRSHTTASQRQGG